jgi:hypothetical protein
VFITMGDAGMLPDSSENLIYMMPTAHRQAGFGAGIIRQKRYSLCQLAVGRLLAGAAQALNRTGDGVVGWPRDPKLLQVNQRL